MRLSDKVQDLQREVRRLSDDACRIESGKSSLTWKYALDTVKDVESALRKVRAVIRKNATQEKRDACPHPDRSRDQHGSCVACGKSKLDSAPALALCVCGAPRWRHDSSDRERLYNYVNGEFRNCDGFQVAHQDLKSS